jgi:hypothetical protein
MLTKNTKEEDKNEMELREMDCEAQRRMVMAKNHVQWQALVLVVLNFRVLLPQG